MIKDSIYKIDFNKLVIWLMPSLLRKSVLIAIIKAMLTSIMGVYNNFLLFRLSMIYRLSITPQVCYLEKMLNDKYDTVLRRIYIAKNVTYSELFVYQEEELKPVSLYKDEENKPVFLYTESEASQTAADFIVKVPASLVINEIEFNALLTVYKLQDKEHVIQRF